jgi:hypothetical protein
MTEPLLDYPAAHSMDTDWFAVDGEGNVALFRSGEEGAVPAHAGFAQDSGSHFLEQLVMEAAAEIWSSGSVRDRHCHVHEPAAEDWQREMFGAVLFLRRRPDRQLGRFGDDKLAPRIALKDETLYPVYSGILRPDVYEQLHADGVCAGCGCLHLGRLANLGVFEFECNEYGVPPYGRTSAPQRPVRVDEMPLALRELLRNKRLSTAIFAQSSKIQPIEHVPCETYGGADTYIGTDGETYRLPPRPGQEAAPPLGASREAPAPASPAPINTAKSQATATPRRRWWPFWRR